MKRRGAATLTALTALLVTACGGGVPDEATVAPTVPMSTPAPATAPSATQSPAAATRTTRRFDLGARSTTDPGSPWVVVNKKHPVDPLDFQPDLTLVRGYQVAVAAAPALTRLLAASDRAERARGGAGFGFKIASAYRSYGYQQSVHDGLVATTGQTHADRYSARPGHSEHQTGLAVDLVTPATPACDFAVCFGQTPAGRWLRTHAGHFGFVIRYTAADRRVTGYAPEPWHLRYVGRALAREMGRRHVAALEELFGVTGGGYRGR